MKIIGFVICQDGLPDILRCIESLACCDEIYICDGRSIDGTREWLESVKEIYHLQIFDRVFDNMQNQRNFLLQHLPKDVWVVNIDQDEALNPAMTYYLREYIPAISRNLYEDGKKEERVLALDVPYLILKNDFHHCCFPWGFLRGKVFYYTDDIKFYHPYHSEPSYSPEKMSQYLALSVPPRFAIFHYAFLDPRRMQKRKERLGKLMEKEEENQVKWEYNQWFEAERELCEVPIEFLPSVDLV